MNPDNDNVSLAWLGAEKLQLPARNSEEPWLQSRILAPRESDNGLAAALLQVQGVPVVIEQGGESYVDSLARLFRGPADAEYEAVVIASPLPRWRRQPRVTPILTPTLLSLDKRLSPGGLILMGTAVPPAEQNVYRQVLEEMSDGGYGFANVQRDGAGICYGRKRR